MRFPNRDVFLTVAEAQGWITSDEDGNPIVQPFSHTWAIDEIGPIITTPGVYDEEGNEITPPVWDNRHHVNIQGEVDPEGGYEVFPEHPLRVWSS
jgi:hypothetical protein